MVDLGSFRKQQFLCLRPEWHEQSSLRPILGSGRTSWKQRRAVAADLKPIYQASTVEEAELRLDEFAAKWDGTYPTISLRALWPDIKAIFEPRKGSLAIGLLLIVISRLAGMVLPASMRYLVDDIIGKHNQDMLVPLVAAVVGATILQGISSFTLTQLLSKAAQRLIAELRQKVQSHVARLPISYFDTHKSGELVSRIMNDVEGVRRGKGTFADHFVFQRTFRRSAFGKGPGNGLDAVHRHPIDLRPVYQ